MREVFTGILNISITASILIVVCILVRLIFKNMPKSVRCLMWLLVAVRLAIPFAIESPFSLLPAREYVAISTDANDASKISSQAGDLAVQTETTDLSDNSATNTAEFTSLTVDKYVVKSTQAIDIISIIWLVGVVAVLTYALVAYIRLRRMVDDAVLLRENVYQSEKVGTVFVLGIFSPKIYVPYGLSPVELYMSLNHERAHLARRDHLVKPLGFIIAAVYWFNPLVWLAYILLCRDIELACDEKVIKKIGYNMKKSYSQALLNLSIPRKYISACPVAFGEVGVDERVKNVLKMKKGKKIILAIALAVCGILAICFLTYPKISSKDKAEATTEVTETTVAEADVNAANEITTEVDTAVETETKMTKEDSQKDNTVDTEDDEYVVYAPEDESEYEVHVLQLKSDDGEIDYTFSVEGDEPQTIYLDEESSSKTGVKYVYIDPKGSNGKEVECVYVDDPDTEKVTIDENGVPHVAPKSDEGSSED